MAVYLRAKIEVSSIILTSFRQGVILPPPPPPTQNELLKIPPTLGLKSQHHQKLDNINTKMMDLKTFLCMKHKPFDKIFHLCRVNITKQFC